ncbi:hypothetical protein D3C81_2156090 [compost metagenome]
MDFFNNNEEDVNEIKSSVTPVTKNKSAQIKRPPSRIGNKARRQVTTSDQEWEEF